MFCFFSVVLHALHARGKRESTLLALDFIHLVVVFERVCVFTSHSGTSTRCQCPAQNPPFAAPTLNYLQRHGKGTSAQTRQWFFICRVFVWHTSNVLLHIHLCSMRYLKEYRDAQTRGGKKERQLSHASSTSISKHSFVCSICDPET